MTEIDDVLSEIDDLSSLALVAGALRADGSCPMPGAGRPYLAAATLAGLSRGRSGAGEWIDLLFEDTLPEPIDFGPISSPVLRLWATAAGAGEAARVLSAVFDEAEFDAVVPAPVVLDDAIVFRPMGPRRVRLLLVDVDPAAFDGDDGAGNRATEVVTYAIGIGRAR